MNTQTMAWTRFKNIPSHCWAEYKGKLLFGGPSGVIYEMNSGKSDNGNLIRADLQTAYNYLGTEKDKLFNYLKALSETSGDVSIQVGISTNFAQTPIISSRDLVDSPTLRWEELTWQNWVWGQENTVRNEWQEIHGQGSSVSIGLVVEAKGIDLSIYSFDMMYQILHKPIPN